MYDNKMMDLRELIYGIDTAVPLNSGKWIVPINFDNAATTPPFKSVVRCVNHFLPYYGSIGRGKGYKSSICTEVMEHGRERILKFFNLGNREDYTVVFCKNTTEGINHLANILVKNPSEVNLTTRMEHHSNDLPWRSRGKVEYVEVDVDGRLILGEFEEKLKKIQGLGKVVSVTGASNITGYINNVHKIAALAHRYGRKIVVDGAQLIPHKRLDMQGNTKAEEIDFLVFSAHKMYAPYGIGVIVGKKEAFDISAPYLPGGGTVDVVLDDNVIWNEAPSRSEGGTQNIVGMVALVEAMNVMERIGYKKIEESESILREHLVRNLKKINGITIYGDIENRDRVGLISFNFDKMYHEDLANALSDIRGIAVRSGCFCAQPYAKRLINISDEEASKYINNTALKKPGMVRVSFGIYNTVSEVDEFLNVIDYIVRKKNR